MRLLLSKSIQNKTLEHAHRKEMIKSEVEILKMLNHASIIKYKNYYETEDTIYIILELFEGIPLNEYIENRWEKLQDFYSVILIYIFE